MKKYILLLLIIITLTTEYFINKNIINSLVFMTGIISTYYAFKENKLTFLFGLINNMICAYLYYLNNLNILKMFTIIILIPFQFLGIFFKENEQNKYLKTDSKKLIYICVLLFILIIILINNSIIKSMDLISSALNSVGLFLMLRGYVDCWYIWLINNIIDLLLWLVLLYQNSSSNAIVMITICCIYIFINVLGIKKKSYF